FLAISQPFRPFTGLCIPFCSALWNLRPFVSSDVSFPSVLLTHRKFLPMLKPLSEAFWIASDNSFHAFFLGSIPWNFLCLSATGMRRKAHLRLDCVYSNLRTHLLLKENLTLKVLTM